MPVSVAEYSNDQTFQREGNPALFDPAVVGISRLPAASAWDPSWPTVEALQEQLAADEDSGHATAIELPPDLFASLKALAVASPKESADGD